MSLKTVTTARGNIAVQYKGYIYRKYRTLVTGDVNWRCVSRTCSASLKTSSDFITLRNRSGVHNHPTSTSASPAPSPPVTPSPSTSPDMDSPACDKPTPSPSPSLTELLSPYTTISPVLPKYNSLDKENSHLRQRVAELEYMTDALTNRAIDLETQLIEVKQSALTTSDTPHTTPHPPSPPEVPQTLMSDTEILKQPCEQCKIFCEEIKNMLQSIRILEEEIKILKQHPATTIQPNLSPNTVIPGPYNLQLKNSFEILTSIQDSDIKDNREFTIVNNKKKNSKKNRTSKWTSKQNKTNKTKKVVKNKKIKIPFNHVTVVGDSHSRGLAALMASSTTHHTCFTGVCKPGAGLLDIAPTSTPPPNHAYVLIAGTNDVAAGREDVIFRHMEQVIKKCKESSKVLVAPLPPRLDLSPGSPVHESVALVNNFISELCCRHEGVEVLDISDLGRRHHTRHGLHLNAAGKSFIASLITKQLAQASWASLRRRSAESPATAPPRLSPPRPTTMMNHECYADAVKTTIPTAVLSAPTRQTDSTQTKKSLFLGNPPLAAQN